MKTTKQRLLDLVNALPDDTALVDVHVEKSPVYGTTGEASQNAICRIDVSFDALKVPVLYTLIKALVFGENA